MYDFFSKIVPVILVFFIGFFLKRVKILHYDNGDLLLKIVFNLTLPALVFISVAEVELSINFIYLPIIAALMILINFSFAFLYSKKLHLTNTTRGTFIIGSMIMNTGFVLPFVLARYGNEALAIYTIFDFGNMLMIFTFGYFIAMRFGETGNEKIDLKKFLKLPPIWALFFGLVFNLMGWEISTMTQNIFEMIGTPTVFLTMLALGCYFHPHIKNLPNIVMVLGIRILGGLIFGILLSNLLGFEDMLRKVVIICTSAPVGYNTLVLSSLENLDKEFAASLVSISLILGIIYVPVLMFVI